MPDIGTGFTRTQIDAEPERSKQSKELACHEIHLCGGRSERERLKTFTLLPACEFSLLSPDFHTKVPLRRGLGLFPQQSVHLEKVQETENLPCPRLVEEARKVSHPLMLAKVALPTHPQGAF